MSSPNSFVDQTGDMSNMTVIRRLSINRLLVGMVPRWWTQRMENAGGTEEHPISVSSDPCIPRPRIRGRPPGHARRAHPGPEDKQKRKTGGRSPEEKEGNPGTGIELRPDCWTLFIRIQSQATGDAPRNSSGVRPPSRIWRRLVFQCTMYASSSALNRSYEPNVPSPCGTRP